MIFRRILLIGFALNLSFFGLYTKGHREWQKKLLSMISGWNKRKIIIWEVCSCGTGSCIISPTKCFPNWMVACGDNMGNLWRNENHIRTRRKKMYNRLIFLFSVWLCCLYCTTYQMLKLTQWHFFHFIILPIFSSTSTQLNIQQIFKLTSSWYEIDYWKLEFPSYTFFVFHFRAICFIQIKTTLENLFFGCCSFFGRNDILFQRVTAKLDVEGGREWSENITTITKLLYPLRFHLISNNTNGFHFFEKREAFNIFSIFCRCQRWINKIFDIESFSFLFILLLLCRRRWAFSFSHGERTGYEGKEHIEWHKQDWKLFDGKLSGNKYVRSRKIDV